MTTDPKKPEAEEPATEIVSIKGFNLDWTCRTGDQGAASATGHHGIALAGGYEGKALAAEGCALFLVSRDYDTGKIIHAWAGIAGRDGIKPLVWYTLGVDGKPVEAI